MVYQWGGKNDINPRKSCVVDFEKKRKSADGNDMTYFYLLTFKPKVSVTVIICCGKFQ